MNLYELLNDFDFENLTDEDMKYLHYSSYTIILHVTTGNAPEANCQQPKVIVSNKIKITQQMKRMRKK